MTVMQCPQGCGGIVNTATDDVCPSCRRGLNEVEVILEPDAVTEGRPDAPVCRRPEWCWEWHGPSHHRMRCRLPIGHSGAHWHKETRPSGEEMVVSTDGIVIFS